MAAKSSGATRPASPVPPARMRNFRYSDFFIRPSSHTTIEATVSLPWIVEMSKQSMRRGTPGSSSTTRSVSSASKFAAMFSLKRVRYDSSALRVASSTSAFLSPRCGTRILTRRPARDDNQSSIASQSSISTGRFTSAGGTRIS